MSRLWHRVNALEKRSKNIDTGKVFLVGFDKNVTDQMYDDFVAGEKARLGATNNDLLIVLKGLD